MHAMPFNIPLLLPYLILSAGAVIVMLAAAFLRRDTAPGITFLTLGASLLASAFFAPPAPTAVTGLLLLDGLSSLTGGLVIFAAFSVAVLAKPYLAEHGAPQAEFSMLLLLGTLGGLVVATSSHFVSLFLGIELVTMPLVAMAAYLRGSSRGLEAGIKYLVLGGISSAFLLFGVALLYAGSGTLSFAALQQPAGPAPLHAVGTVLLIAGLGFKLALAPFHTWAPDVYEGAPAPVTAFAATVSKAAVIAALFRLFPPPVIGNSRFLFTLFAALAIASMTIGNIMAIRQQGVKRMLAYSSIAQAGYLLVAFVSSGPLARPAVVLYLVAYIVTNLAAFGSVSLLAGAGSDLDSLDRYRGLFWRRPWTASVLTISVLSLLGIPVTGGFIAKYSAAWAGVESGRLALVIVLAVNTAISAGYYLRIVMTLFLDHELAVSSQSWRAADPLPLPGLVAITFHAALVLAIGVMPQYLLRVIGKLLA